LHFPAGGLDLTQPFDRQVPRPMSNGMYVRTTLLGQNVRGYEPGTSRMRGGQRPGLAKYVKSAVATDMGGNGFSVQGLNAIIGQYPDGGGSYIPGSTGNTYIVYAMASIIGQGPSFDYAIWDGGNPTYAQGGVGGDDPWIISDGTNFFLINNYSGALQVTSFAASTNSQNWQNTYSGNTSVLTNGAKTNIDTDGTYAYFSIDNGSNQGIYKIALADGTGTNPWLAIGGNDFGEVVSVASTSGVIAVQRKATPGLIVVNLSTKAIVAKVSLSIGTVTYCPSICTDGTDFYVIVNGTYGNFGVTKVSHTGAIVWTNPNVGPIENIFYFPGTGYLTVSGPNISLSLNAATGVVTNVGIATDLTSAYYVGTNLAICSSATTSNIFLTDGYSRWYQLAGAFNGRGIAGTTPSVYDTGQYTDFNVVTTAQQKYVTLVGVCGGDVKVLYAGQWYTPTNGTNALNISAGVVRSAVNSGALYFCDATNWKYYSPVDNTVHVWTPSSGSLPVDSNGFLPRLICTWRGRTVLSGLPGDPGDWFMSAVNDPTDWNYAPISASPTQAIAGSVGPQGVLADSITALIPYTDDVLILGCDHSLYMMQGDPANGGQIVLVSNLIGVAFGEAWCMDPYGTIYFVSNRCGIYSLVPGQAPLRISQGIEQLLATINTGEVYLRMAWDDVNQGIHVFVTGLSPLLVSQHYFWEWRSSAWWTSVFANGLMNPLCCFSYFGNLPSDRVVLLGCEDGFVRYFSNQAQLDDGTAIQSSVIIGPLLSADLDAVCFKEAVANFGMNSGPVQFAIYSGPTAEIALNSTPVVTGTWTAGRNYATYIRRSDHAHFVELTAANAWSMESIRAKISYLGKVRARNP